MEYLFAESCESSKIYSCSRRGENNVRVYKLFVLHHAVRNWICCRFFLPDPIFQNSLIRMHILRTKNSINLVTAKYGLLTPIRLQRTFFFSLSRWNCRKPSSKYTYGGVGGWWLPQRWRGCLHTVVAPIYTVYHRLKIPTDTKITCRRCYLRKNLSVIVCIRLLNEEAVCTQLWLQ